MFLAWNGSLDCARGGGERAKRGTSEEREIREIFRVQMLLSQGMVDN
jgi:hypothetical protein